MNKDAALMEWRWQWHSIGISLHCFILPSEAT